jgi:predicted metal-binding protein
MLKERILSRRIPAARELTKEGSMASKKELEAVFRRHGYTDFRWLDPRRIVVAQWPRLKCVYGCSEYGRTATCPPNVPTVEECARFFQEYRRAVVFHFKKKVARPADRFAWTRRIDLGLLRLEREVFLGGHEKSFLLFLDSCNLCADCPGGRESCRKPRLARPTPEALGVDVYATVRALGYPIEVLSRRDQPMNRYAFLLID